MNPVDDDPPDCAAVRRGPGRPRSLACQAAVLRATSELLGEVRYADLTMESVAKRAGVAKQTLYRWWPSRARLVMEAYREKVTREIRIFDTGDLDGDLERIVVETARALGGNGPAGLGSVFAGLIADAQGDADLLDEFRSSYLTIRRARIAALLEGAMTRGDLPAHTDVETALDLLYGPIWLRLLVRHSPLDAKFAKVIVRTVLVGLRGTTCSSAAGPRSQPPEKPPERRAIATKRRPQ